MTSIKIDQNDVYSGLDRAAFVPERNQMKKLLFLATAIASLSTFAMGNPLTELRGEHRVLVLDFPQGASFLLSQFERQINRSRKDIEERDLIILHIGELGKNGRKYAKELTFEERDAIRDAFGLGETSQRPAVSLIGKDGKLKKVQTSDFDLVELLKLIDTMPMRQAEMKERGE